MTFVFVSKDETEFAVTKEMASLSAMVHQMFDCGVVNEGTATKIPIEQFDKKDLGNLVNWMKLYIEMPRQPEQPSKKKKGTKKQKNMIAEWERRFFMSLPENQLTTLVNLANYMQVNALLDPATTYIAEILSSKSVEDARTYLGLKNDFSLVEERELQERLAWLE